MYHAWLSSRAYVLLVFFGLYFFRSLPCFFRCALISPFVPYIGLFGLAVKGGPKAQGLSPGIRSVHIHPNPKPQNPGSYVVAVLAHDREETARADEVLKLRHRTETCRQTVEIGGFGGTTRVQSPLREPKCAIRAL